MVHEQRPAAFGLCLHTLAAPRRGDRGDPAPRTGPPKALMSSSESPELVAPRKVTAGERQTALKTARADVVAAQANFKGLAFLGVSDPRTAG